MNKLTFKVFVLIMLLFNQLIAGDETRNSRLYANNVVPNSFILTQDDKFTGVAGWNSTFTNLSNKAVIELGIDEEKHLIHAGMMICAKFDVQVTDANLNTTVYTNQQLTTNYNPQVLTRYTDKAQIVFPNAYKIKVYNITITSCALNSNCSSCNTPYNQSDVYLQTEVTTSRIYNFNFSSGFSVPTDLTHALNSTTQELVISWNYLMGAEEYELEYTYIDSYSSVFGTSSQTYDFNFDATRIITTANTYSIPLTYEQGYLVYRIRPIGRSTTNQRMEGVWYGAPASGAINGAGNFVQTISAFNADKFNWTSIKTFAENGKFGVGVTFNDALGYSRQTLARLNTESKSIAQNTLYDYYGRPTINLLPAPVSGKYLNYRNALNMYRSTPQSQAVVFDKHIFGLCDQTNNICSSGAYLLDSINSIGAANYYSPTNPNKEGYQGYVPDAEGVPYTQVKYKPDALGRVEKQSLPGLTHTLGSSKEIKYFYAQPTQVELDRIFGSEAGRAKYHYKNVTIDPNGQVSAAYLDNYGRTIATYLMGLNPLNVDILPSNVPKIALTENLHLAPTNDADPVNQCYEVNTSYFVSSASQEGYVYHTTLGTFASTCVTNPVCYDCVYDVILSIKDDCGNEIFDHDGLSGTAPGYTASIGKQPPYVPVTCGSSPTGTFIAGTALNSPVTIVFPRAGVYTVYKKICVSEDPITDYTNHFIDNRCDDKKCYLVDSILSMADFSACNQTMTCQQCNDLVALYNPTDTIMTVSGSTVSTGQGTTTYTTSVYSPSMTPQQLSAALENCEKLCPPKTQCEKYTKALLKDFYPGGQYADTIVGGTNWPYSIFNSGNLLAGSITFQTPTNYQNAAGAPDYVQLNGVNTAINALNMTQYIQYYRKSWAKALLQYHPEYCKLYYYCNIIGASQDYDDAMNGINHYDSACATGFFFPINNNWTTPSYKPQGCSNVTNYDPVVNLTTLSTAYSNTISNFVAQITTNFNGAANQTTPVFDIYRYVMAQSNSQAATGNVNDWLGKDSCRQDKDWLTFKQFYLGKKAALYHKLDSLYFLNPSTYGCHGSVSAPAGYVSPFPNISSTLSGLFPNSTSLLYTAMNTPTAPMTPGASSNFTAALNTLNTNMTSNMNNTLTSQCTTACNSYTNYWHTTLMSGCIAYGNATQQVKDNIINALVGVCMNGCDYTSNLGGASTTSPNNAYTLPSTAITVTSFQQVLNYYLTGNVNTSACSAIILTQPAPYPSTPSSSLALTSCKCDQILQVESDYYQMATANPPTLPAGIDAPWKLFRKRYGFDLQEYNLLKCICKAALSTPWAPGHPWTGSELTALAQNTMNVNPKFTCTSCMKCSDVATAIDNLNSQLPSPITYPNVIAAITQDSINQIFAIATLNSTFGSHPFQDYLDLYEDCQSFTATPQTFTNTVSDEAIDLFHYLNQLVKDKLLTKTPRPVKLCTDSKYFLSSLYTGSLPNIPTYNYNYTPSGNNMNFTITDASNNTILSINLTFPVTYTGTWQSFIYLSNLVAYCPVPVSPGANYGFQVQATDNLFGVVTLTGSIVNQAYPITTLSSGTSPVPQLCPKTPKKLNTCAINLINNALTQAEFINNQFIDSLKAHFQKKYKNACYEALNETFTRNYQGGDEYHFTLYYYDESGNLQRTVAPNGVSILTSVVSPITSPIYPAHSNINGVDLKYVSDYRYSSYDQPITEKTIDGGNTYYYYDEAGRIVASQNAKQAANSTNSTFVYSYTRYDDNGRIKEVGEMTTSSNLSSFGVFIPNTSANPAFDNILTAATKTQVTQTYYDELPTGYISSAANTYFLQNANKLSNLRNRVSCVIYNDNPASPSTYQFATYYSYDDHGNVKRLLQENNTLPTAMQGVTGSNGTYENQFKIIDYKYELISGNMVEAVYQKDFADQLIHRYVYDADNRLQEVFTSFDNINFDRDAKYFYYEHGPLARIERADKQVQGADYMYTIHGWIKGINGEALNINSDAGKDGSSNNTYLSSYAQIHNYFGRDAMSFSLNYYNNNTTGAKDYKAIKRSAYNTSSNIDPQMSMANLYNNTNPFYLDVNGAGDGANLYNGNISSMVTSLIDKDPTNNITNNTAFPMLSGYRYDQLHRITKMKTYRGRTGNTWDTPTGSNYDDSYKMTFSYDPNGNIGTLFRNGPSPALLPGSTLAMDDLIYSYYKSLTLGGVVTNNSYNSNKLACVTDNIAAGNYSEDVDHYNCSEQFKRYQYDEIGNLKQDRAECIDEIVWTTDRKIKEVKRSISDLISQGKTLPDIEYLYNAMRQRVVKIVKPRDQTTKALKPQSAWVFTYYAYDAAGNVMAVYDRRVTNNGSTYTDAFKLDERHIYGSSRLAIARPANTVQWTFTYTPCGGEGDQSNCRTISLSAGPGIINLSAPYGASRNLGYKEFELTNHLGNVLAVVSDRKIQLRDCPGTPRPSDPLNVTCNYNGSTFYGYFPDILMHTDYYAFGQEMPGRTWKGTSDDYRYSISGSEDEKSINSGITDFGDRFYDGRIGRWFKTDLFKIIYPSMTPYGYVKNSPIQFADADGNLVIYANGLRFNASIFRGLSRIFNPFRAKLGDDKTIANKEGVYKSYSQISGIVGDEQGYWGEIRQTVNTAFGDDNNLFVDGTNKWGSKGSRYDEGQKAAITLDEMIKSGEVKLDPCETIKIVGHSQGGMYAAGMAKKLIEMGYPVEIVVYIAPHQPKDIQHPDGLPGIQFSRPTDGVSSTGIIPNTVARSEYGEIDSKDVRFIPMPKIDKFFGEGGFRGHDVHTYQDIGGLIQMIYDLVKSPCLKGPDVSPSPPAPDPPGPSSCSTRQICCFVAGTKIKLGNYSEMNIEKIKVGDSVITYNFAANKFESSIVTRISSPIKDSLIEIIFNDGTKNVNTDDHPYFTENNGWCSFKPKDTYVHYNLNVNKLKPGDTVFMYKNNLRTCVRIKSIKRINSRNTTYNIFTEKNHNYFANGILVYDETKIINNE